MRLRNQAASATSGYVMAAMLVVIGIMAVLLTVAMPVWRHEVQREKEEELVFRGQQYVRAIALFQRKYAASFPPSVDVLVTQKFLRKKYADPMTPDGEFQVLYQMANPAQAARPGGRGGAAGAVRTEDQGAVPDASPSAAGTIGPRGGIIGVASKSTDASIRLYNGRDHYNQWQFVFVPTMLPGQGGARPGMRGGPRGFDRGGSGGRRGFGQEGGSFRPGTNTPGTPGQGQRGPS